MAALVGCSRSALGLGEPGPQPVEVGPEACVRQAQPCSKHLDCCADVELCIGGKCESTCRADGVACNSPSDCCGGSCRPDGVCGRTAPAAGCLTGGQVCARADQCCTGECVNTRCSHAACYPGDPPVVLTRVDRVAAGLALANGRLLIGSSGAGPVVSTSVYGGPAVAVDKSSGHQFVSVGTSVYWTAAEGVRVARADGTIATAFPGKARSTLGIDWDGIDLQWLESSESSSASRLRWGRPGGALAGEMLVGPSPLLAAQPGETFLLVHEGADLLELTGVRRDSGSTRRFGFLLERAGAAVRSNPRWVYACAATRVRLGLASLEFQDKPLVGSCNSIAITDDRVFLGMGSGASASVLSWTHKDWNSDGDVLAERPEAGGGVSGIAVDASCIYYVWSHGGEDGRVYRLVRPR